ncbi:hypothetical protein ACWD0G_07190 [Streptomyces goshikiensis]
MGEFFQGRPAQAPDRPVRVDYGRMLAVGRPVLGVAGGIFAYQQKGAG